MKREYTFWLIAFLVLLRLAIGWHFFVEGSKKVQSMQAGKSLTNTPFSSAGYLRGASGPLAGVFRWQAGDLDKEALARLEIIEPAAKGEDRRSYRKHLSPALNESYDEYFKRFVAHLKLDDNVKKTATARLMLLGSALANELEQDDETKIVGLGEVEFASRKLGLAKEKAARFLLGLDAEDAVEVTVPLQTGPAKIKKTPPRRIDEYRDRLSELREMEEREMPSFEKPVRQEHYKEVRADVNRLRNELMADLDRIATTRLEESLSVSQADSLKSNPLPQAEAPVRLRLTDYVVSWGLLIVGGCLLVGLFTRFSCVVGAGLMLAFYLAQPALLGVPENPKAEGFYFIVNKNIIEMLALLALAATPSGRWLGLDSVLYYLFRRREPKPAPKASAPTPSPEKQPLAVS